MPKKQTITKYTIITSLTIITILLLTTTPTTTTTNTQTTTTGIIKLKDTTPNQQTTIQSMGLKIVDQIPNLNLYIVQYSGNFANLQTTLNTNPQVELAEMDKPIQPAQTPNDPYLNSQWHLQKIGAQQAWNITTGNPATTIAILDSGVDPTQPDLAAKLQNGWNFYDDNANTTDLSGHGTKVAGVAASITNNGIGVASIGYQCSILPVKVTDPNGYTTYSMLPKGLVYAADHGAKVAVISFEVNGASALNTAAQYFIEKGGLVFTAGGNTGNYIADPSNPYTISVSGTTSTDGNYGSYGPYIDLSAPAIGIYTTINGGGYGAVSGTSFATPLTAGVAALMFSANPNLTPANVESILKASANDLGAPGYDQVFGYGRINASYALQLATNQTSTDPVTVDTTAPTVAISSPTTSATVTGTLTVSVSAADNVAVAKTELYIDGVLKGSDSNAPYEFSIDTTSLSSGTHTLQAKAFDTSNNDATSTPVTITVTPIVSDTTPPTVAITSPKNTAKASATTAITVSAADNLGIDRVEIYIDGTLMATLTSEPYTYLWNTLEIKNSAHVITAKAYDIYGNVAQNGVKVNVSNK